MREQRSASSIYGVLMTSVIPKRGEDTPSSDVDILVGFEEGQKTFDNYIELKFYLEELLEREVDLITIESVHPLMREHIMREAVYV